MKSKHLTFRCTPEEYATIKAHCGDNLSQFIVSRLMKAIRKKIEAGEPANILEVINRPDGYVPTDWLKS